MQDLKIGLIQTQLFWENKTANFAHFEEQFFNGIRQKELDLLLLPEMFNTGFSMNVDQLGETMDGETIIWMQKWAKKLNCHIAGSMIVKEGEKYFNRMAVVSGTGVEATYDKRHLFRMAGENNHFSAGQNRTIFELKGWKLMLQVCYDLRFPIFSRNRTIEGEKEYDALVYVANWPQKRAFIWKNLIQARAIENQAYAIGLNRVGVDGKGIDYSGDSMAVDPWGNILSEFSPHLEELRIIQLKYQVLEDIKSSFPAFLDADNYPNLEESMRTTGE